ncbi:MAG: glutathione S-transferase family protein [Terricaulis sp.]
MAIELVFYTNPMSRGRIVRWMLEEVGQPYRTEVLEYGASMKAPEYLAINPMGKVPAIKHGDAVITETGAICAYLADAFPQTGLAPALSDRRRGPYLRWMFYAAGCVEPAAWLKAMQFEPPEDRRRMVGYGTMTEVLNTLEGAVSQGEYILGDMFSAADVYLGSQIGWGVQFGTLEKRPAFEAYLGRIMGRPAAKRAREIDDALIPKN